VGYSSLARRVDLVLPTLAGKERAVASTKAYACQITVLSLIASALSSSVPYFESVSEQSIKEMESVAKRYAQKFSHNEIFILGRGLDYVTAKECALKIKEVSYVNANAYPTGELKHGFIALLTRDTPVIMFAFDKDLIKKNISGALECKSRGASVVVITPFVSDFCDEFDVVEISSPLRAVAYSFLFALELSLARKLNPDMPKNLAKSVTVE
jgi:glucosamine--fructose-6-phosphate aminotransferase (isomerizing)